jgi:polysaccharide biosynthesis/export protein
MREICEALGRTEGQSDRFSMGRNARRRRGAYGWLMAVCAIALLSMASLAETNQPPVISMSLTTNATLYTSIDALDNQQKLGLGDRVSYRVIEDKDEPRSLVVTDSGELDIPYLGRVRVSDKTCQTLAKEVKAALEKELYYRATVILAIDQLNKKRGSVYLVGQIRAAGPVEIPSDEVFTVSKAILRAGGFSEFADKKRVKITRKPITCVGPTQVFTVNVIDILERGQTEKDLKLEPGDLIFVASRLLNF